MCKGMSTAPGASQNPGEVLLNPLFGLRVVGKGLFRGPEQPVMGERAAISAHPAQLVMEHLVIKDVFDHVSRNRRAVQHRVNSYDPLVGRIGSEAYGPGSPAPFPRSPRNRTTQPPCKIDLVESMEMASQVHMVSFRMKTRHPWFCGRGANPDLLFVIPDEVLQQGFPPLGRPPDESGEHSQDFLRSIEKHLMKPHRAGPVFPFHGDHGPRIIRDRQRQGEIQKLPKP